MSRLGLARWVIGLGGVLAAGSAWADGPFVGRWHLNPAESILPPGEPAPKDLIAEISQADGARVRWTLTVVARGKETMAKTYAPAKAVLANLEAFADAATGGKPYPVPQ